MFFSHKLTFQPISELSVNFVQLKSPLSFKTRVHESRRPRCRDGNIHTQAPSRVVRGTPLSLYVSVHVNHDSFLQSHDQTSVRILPDYEIITKWMKFPKKVGCRRGQANSLCSKPNPILALLDTHKWFCLLSKVYAKVKAFLLCLVVLHLQTF